MHRKLWRPLVIDELQGEICFYVLLLHKVDLSVAPCANLLNYIVVKRWIIHLEEVGVFYELAVVEMGWEWKRWLLFMGENAVSDAIPISGIAEIKDLKNLSRMFLDLLLIKGGHL